MNADDIELWGTAAASEALRDECHRLINTVELEPWEICRYFGDLGYLVSRLGEVLDHLARLSDRCADAPGLYHDAGGDAPATARQVANDLRTVEQQLAAIGRALGDIHSLIGHLGQEDHS
jgi:hypothetical protein